MKIAIAQLAVITLIFFGGFYSFMIIIAGNYNIGIPFFLCTLVYVPLWFWAKKDAKKAYTSILVFYIISSVIALKYNKLAIEYPGAVYMHIFYFIPSIVIGLSKRRAVAISKT